MVSVISAPGLWFNDQSLSQTLARSSNEFAAQMIADHPGRFGSLAALPLPDVRASLTELAHAADVLKCDGIGLMTNYANAYLGEPGMDPVCAEINRRRLPVHVHPYTCDCDQEVLPGVPLPMIEFPHSTTRAMVNMLNAGTFTRFPDIPFIFSHAGGTVPFLVNRISRVGSALGKPGWTNVLQQLHYDTAGSANSAAFGPLMELVSAKHVLLGTDFPFLPAEAAGGTVADIERLGLSDADLRDVQAGNARRLFRRIAA